LAPSASASDSGMELAGAGATANQTSLTGSAPETSSATEPSAVQSPSTVGESMTASQSAAPETASASTVNNQNQTEEQPAAQTNPPEQTGARAAPAKTSSSMIVGVSSRRLWIVGGLLLTAVVLIAVAILPALRRGYKFSVPGSSRPEPNADTAVLKARTAPAHTSGVQGNGFAGGPRQVSLQLKAWNSPLRQSTLAPAKAGGAFNRLKGPKPKPSRLPVPIESQPDESAAVSEPFFESVGPVVTAVEPRREEPQREESAPVAEPFFESVGPVLEQAPDVVPPVAIPVLPVFPQPSIPATLPKPSQTPPAPTAKAPAPPVIKPQPQPTAPVPAAGMQTSVHLTASFEIAAMQLTPSFKMGVLKV